MMEPARDLLEFSRKLGAYVGDRPAIPPDDVLQLRMNLIEEEYRELFAAIHSRDLPGIADGALDLVYVLLGTLVACGIDAAPLWAAIQAANMAKLGGPRRGDGKALKPPGWAPPDIAGLLRAQGWPGPTRGVTVSDIDLETA